MLWLAVAADSFRRTRSSVAFANSESGRVGVSSVAVMGTMLPPRGAQVEWQERQHALVSRHEPSPGRGSRARWCPAIGLRDPRADLSDSPADAVSADGVRRDSAGDRVGRLFSR